MANRPASAIPLRAAGAFHLLQIRTPMPCGLDNDNVILTCGKNVVNVQYN